MTTEALAALDALAARFEDLLSREELALRGPDAKAVEQIAGDKAQLVAEIERQLDALKAPASSATEQGARARLHERLSACQHHNRLNGALIEANRSFNNLLLGSLRGQHGGRAQVYGRGGGITEIGGSVSLGRA
ncbi:MAG TPA: hypothetical protein DCY89_01205 [Gammaproteobacteria bacterium]|nr:hypothetical protein [Gammaproteobacteria bacterium]